MLSRRISIASLALVAFFFAAPAFAGLKEGKAAYDAKDWPRALKELTPVYEAGNDQAAHMLGTMHINGWGVAVDKKKAMALYKIAAEKGNTESMVMIGMFAEAGAGTKQDTPLAMQWFKRAAQLGNGTAAYLYGMILAKVNKVPLQGASPDYPEAYKWFKIAADKADPALSRFRGIADNMAYVLSNGKVSTAQREKMDKEIVAWKPVANPDSLGALPSMPVLTP